MLLLLSQDPLLLRSLEDRRRYAPPAAAVTAYLAGTAVWQLAGEASELGVSGLVGYLARNAACLLATLPCQVLLLAWLWSKRKVCAGRGSVAAEWKAVTATRAW